MFVRVCETPLKSQKICIPNSFNNCRSKVKSNPKMGKIRKVLAPDRQCYKFSCVNVERNASRKILAKCFLQ